MAGGSGGAWKVAYADFVTAMMAFFLVMWIVAQDKPMKEAIAGYFRDPFGTESKASGKGILDGQSAAAPVLINLLPDSVPRDPSATNEKEPPAATSEDPQSPEARKPFMIALHDGDKNSVGTTIPFAEDSAELDEAGQARLNELAPRLRGKRNKIEIRGHATMRPLPPGSRFQDVWQLCYARCQATLKHLQEKGVEPERMRLSQAGAFEPYTQSAEPGSHVQNSRVDVYLLGEYVEDLQGTRKERAGRLGGHETPPEEPSHTTAVE